MIDWNRAPKEATHHAQFENHECWYAVNGYTVELWNQDKEWEVVGWSAETITTNNAGNCEFTARPKAAQENEAVKNPKHYQTLGGVNTIEQIVCTLTEAEWLGACKFCIQKYRLRAGKKGDAMQDIEKANEVERLHGEYKHLCREDK